MHSTINTKDKVSIPKEEYSRLKQLDNRFSDFWDYLENLMEIREARKEVKEGKFISQQELFNELGI